LPPGVAVPETLPARVDGEAVEIRTEDPVRTLHDLTDWALAQGVPLEALEVARPSLEDIYLELTRE
jgi:ABC-2 type transport system ATP-binding protein